MSFEDTIGDVRPFLEELDKGGYDTKVFEGIVQHALATHGALQLANRHITHLEKKSADTEAGKAMIRKLRNRDDRTQGLLLDLKEFMKGQPSSDLTDRINRAVKDLSGPIADV